MPSETLSAERPWRGRSHGGGLGHALVRAFARWGGRDLCYLLIIPPTCWFYVRDGAARRATVNYWRTLQPTRSAFFAHLNTLRHFYAFARSLADRFIAALDRRAIRWEEDGLDRLTKALRHPRGCILLSAHLGSFELASFWLAGRYQGTLHLVMLRAEDPQVEAQVRRTMGEQPFRIIGLEDPVAAGLAIASALNNGETCAILGDRTIGDISGTVTVPFLGRPARFPIGPFIAAAVTGALVVPTFCVRVGWARYRCVADEPWTIDLGPRAERQARLQSHVARWAARLETEVRAHPEQWNNYYPFWEV